VTLIFIIFLVAIAVINLAIGYALCWVRFVGGPRPDEVAPADHKGDPTAGVTGDNETALTRSADFLAHLQELANNVQDLAGQHTTRLGEITAALDNEGDGNADPAKVLAAATAIIKANRQLEQELANTKLEIEEQQRRLETTSAVARTDALTGILNRRAYDEELATRYNHARQTGTPMSLLIFDVDHFKKFNDEFGHQAGDAVLRGVAQVLTSARRDTDVIARYGGEEFCALLPATTLEDAKVAAERLRLAVAQAEFKFEGIALRVTVSVGLAASTDTIDTDMLIKRADTALYEAKKNGRNRSYYHDGQVALPVVVDSAPPSHGFSSQQRIAPYIDGQFPNLSQFREVHCEELSATGFTFLSASEPTHQQWVVSFGTPERPFYRVAEVQECVNIGTSNKSMFRVACVFTDQTDDDDGVGEVIGAAEPAASTT
jgi:diguanylate cyclase (GGDEF)-like protein